VFSAALLLLALGACAAYVYCRRESFRPILGVPLTGVLALAFLGVGQRTVEAIVLRMCVARMGTRMDIAESQVLCWATAYWNMLPAKPGTGALAVYLKREHGLPYSNFVAYLLAVNLLRVMTIGVVGAATAVPLWLFRGLTFVVPLVFTLMAGGCIVVIALPARWQYAGQNRILRAVSNTSRAWHEMRGRRRLLARIVLWKVAEVLLGAFSIYLCFRLIGVGIAPLQALTVMLLSTLGRFAGIIPGQLGVKEALIGAAGAAFGFSFADGVVAAALRRVVWLPLVGILGPLSSWVLHRRLTCTDRPAEPAGLDVG
jgi:uncharacterized membrane protein YbhN (UPF0104 family)